MEYHRNSPMSHEHAPEGYWTIDAAAKARIAYPTSNKPIVTLYPTAEEAAAGNIVDHLTAQERCDTLNSMREHSDIRYRIEMAKRN